MAKKQTGWKTKGINRDLSVSAFNPEFAFENMNLRLSTNDSNTTLSWVNEKGTAAISLVPRMWDVERPDLGMCEIVIQGSPVGTAVLNHTLVLFTHESPSTDRIYTIKYEDPTEPSMKARLLYHGNLNLDTQHPLETLVSYESEKIQKVYWVDGKNQPRVINIAVDGIQNKPASFFDFVPTLQLKEEITVNKIIGGNGIFAPGVIQYAFTYYNKYGQESNIFYTTPLYYLSHRDRGASPEDKVDNAFRITVSNVDKNFDYLRIYSIQRTSINATPICKRIQDIDIQNLFDGQGDPTSTASYTDTGTSGDSIDPTELLYKGGEPIIANTVEQKDGTLFLGNFKNERESLNDIKGSIVESTTVASESSDPTPVPYTRTIIPTQVSTGNYPYSSQLTATNGNGTTNVPCGGFKRGDYYRCGVQFQHKTGKWSEPIFISDVEVKGTPSISGSGVTLPVLKGQITDASTIGALVQKDYKKVRPVVVFPELKDRITLCQGIVAPTVYTTDQRGTGAGNTSSLYAQSSWFFRFPYTDQSSQIDASSGTVSPYFPSVGTNNPIPYIDNGTNTSPDSIRAVEIQGCFDSNHKFHVDKEFLTFHSPDVEFDTQLWNTSFYGVNGVQVGTVGISKTLSDISIQTETPTVSTKGGGFDHKSFLKSEAKGIVSGLFYEDFAVDDAGEEGAGGTERDLVPWSYERSAYRWMVYTWNKDGSLNNDINRPAGMGTPSAILKKKVISNLRITDGTNYMGRSVLSDLTTPELYSGDEPTVIKVGGNVYQGNIDTMLVPQESDGMYFAFPFLATQHGTFTINPDPGAETSGVSFTENVYWKTFGSLNGENHGIYYWDTDANPDCWTEANAAIGTSFVDLVMKKQGIRMKYKSTPHLVFGYTPSQSNPGLSWGTNSLPIVELQRNSDPNMFGGTSTDALKENNWLPCGEPVPLCDANGDAETSVEFEYSYGDTYFQRWDCLKTYAFTPEDINQVVEIGSFMLETHVNIDGRYDRNRGQVNNTYMSPRNFNLINDVYSQKDNFFTYKILDNSYYDNTKYLNQITWSLTKEAGADVDLWTNITLASVLELDGDKGELNKLIRFNNFLFAFQDTGISQILYNDNVQIQSTQGVPIEIANSGKVSGKDYKSSSIGCSNKWSMVTTPMGIYFMDSNDKNIYLFNGQLSNVSGSLGFNSWAKQNIPAASEKWNPETFSTFTSFYDRLNQDVLFVNSEIALAYSERLGAFTSFYNYGDAPFFVNLDDTGIWIKDNILWKHNAGGYCEFFGEKKPYWTILVGNPEPQLDKIFTNLEFRACVEGDGELDQETGKFTPALPFDYLETWNEYQRGVAFLSNRNAADAFRHNDLDGNASLKRKFRIWRCDIPRNNFERLSGSSFDLTFDYTFRPRSISHKANDRMRNPWLYLKLMKNWAEDQETMPKTEVHDLIMTYFG